MASYVASRKIEQVSVVWNDGSQVPCAETVIEILSA